MNLKRDRLSIMHDMLSVIRSRGGKIKPTHIMYKANLSHQMLTEYLAELIEKQFIEEKKDAHGKRTYALTDKGFNFLKDYGVIKGFMDSYGLE